MSASVLDRLGPPELVESAITRPLASFLANYGDALVLLFRVGEGDAELALGLRTGRGEVGAAAAEPMQFHTVAIATDQLRSFSIPPRPEAPLALGQLLQGASYRAVPLRKREEADAMSADRVSVGRARNKDIVLRHASVSKFHAWFQVDPAGAVRLTDAGSKNLTRVNGDALPPREAKRIDPGDRIRFGSVDCTTCTAEGLWSAVRAISGTR